MNSHSMGGQGRIDVNPLLDVMLTLLVFMMLLCPSYRHAVTLPPDPPEDSPAADGVPWVCNYPITLSLGRSGRLYICKEQVSRSDFVFRLRQATQGASRERLYLIADGSRPYQEVLDFIDLCRQGTSLELALVLHDEFDGPNSPWM